MTIADIQIKRVTAATPRSNGLKTFVLAVLTMSKKLSLAFALSTHGIIVKKKTEIFQPRLFEFSGTIYAVNLFQNSMFGLQMANNDCRWFE